MTVPTVGNDKKWLTCQLTVDEFDILEAFCKKHNRTKTEVIRDFIRNAEDLQTLLDAIRDRVRRAIIQEISDPTKDLEELKSTVKKIEKKEKKAIATEGMPLVLPGGKPVEDDSYNEIFS